MNYSLSGDKIVLDAPLDYEAILTCGQIFRYRQIDGGYEVISGEHRCVTQGKEIVCDDPQYFVRFFDLDTDYERYIQALSRFTELKEALETGKGIRILRQDLFETIIGFIISANNNIPRIKGILNRICDYCGKDMGEYRAFPSPQRLAKVSAGEFRSLGVGFRDSYLEKTTKVLANSDFMDRVSKADTPSAHKMLTSLSGVGPKVADCILLFGLRRFDCFPVDTWIFGECSLGEFDTPTKVRRRYLDRYGSLAGLAQQYIFYNSRKK